MQCSTLHLVTRREFLARFAAASVMAQTSVQGATAEVRAATSVRPPETNDVPQMHIPISRIKSVIRRDDTILRLGGHGDNFHMSWAADDRQFVSVCDGEGWTEKPKGMYRSRIYAISGGPPHPTFQEVPGYPDNMDVSDWVTIAQYYSYGTLALDGRIYQFLGTPNPPPPDVLACPPRPAFGEPPQRWVGAKLIYSPDNGQTWCNHDGSTPVVWETEQRQSRKNMFFFEEPRGVFSVSSVLQMGKNYEANRDGYIYIYSPNGNTEGTMNELVMCRVSKPHILDRAAYEYFSGLGSNGVAAWTRDIKERAVVHTFAGGWVNDATVHTGEIPWSWVPSVTYNAPLGLYMMANWGTGRAPGGGWYSKPSYLGLYVAPNPWGPWTQVHEETAWMPGNDSAARAYSPIISPKWIAADGRSFWLVWSDVKGLDTNKEGWNDVFYDSVDNPDWVEHNMTKLRRVLPNYQFNAQRVDLMTA
jgi:hypothetical protein